MNSGKVRIYELSRELNLDNKDILAVCEQLNISVKSHSSTITDSEAERIRAAAENYTASHPSPVKLTSRQGSNQPTSESKSRVTAPVQKKQQIVAIKSVPRQSNLEPPTPPSYPASQVGQSQASQAPARPVLNRPPNAANASVVSPSVDLDASSQLILQDDAHPVELTSAIEPSLPLSSESSESAPPSQVASQSSQPDYFEVELPQTQMERPLVEQSNLSHPPIDSDAVEGNLVGERKSDIPKPEIAKPNNLKPDTAPELIAPPQRVENPPPENQQVPSSPSNLSNRPILKPKQVAPSSAGAASGTPRSPKAPGKTGVPAKPSPTGKPQAGGKPAPKPSRPQQTIVELRRPKPVRPEAETVPAGDAKVLGNPEGLNDTGIKINRPRQKSTITTETPAAVDSQQLQPRPTLPRLATKKGKDWDEEEEQREFANKANKLGTKGKRRTQPNLDEEEDVDLELLLDEDEDEEREGSVQVSLSLVRPAKPKSMRQGSPKPAAVAPLPQKAKRSTNYRDRRDRKDQETKVEKPEKIILIGSLTVQELASIMMIPDTDIIRTLFMKGIMATVTQTLDIETATMVAQELGVEVETGKKESEARKITEMLDVNDLENLQRRPPVVTIMGHVDHGKTSLLDSIRKTKVAQGEAGGITQHIGAYHVDVAHNDEMQQVVFLDTPGHAAFTAMRARGARVTDIAILVVAADDGVQPQTVEAISHAKAAEVPIVIAINKIDKEGAQPDRVKQELTEFQLVPEEWGGETIMVPVSAMTGENLDTLLEMILLVAEVEELSANPDRLAKGTVIEAHLDKAKGPVATLLVQNGTLRVGDVLVAGSVFGKVRAMVDDRGQRVKDASPSFAVEVLGLSDVPAAGDEFEVFQDEKEARSIASTRTDEKRQSRLLAAMSSRRVSLNTLSARAQEGELKELNLVLKADVQGSVEAILGSLKKLPQNEVQVRVLYAAPGEISETDIDLAAASSAVIIGFNTTLAPGARQAADRLGVDVRDYNIIYTLLDDIQAAMEGLLEPELVEEALGQVEVRAVFPVGRGQVAGCYVQSGKAIRNCKIRIRRNGQVIHETNLDSLKRMKEDVKEVNSGFECGIGIDDFNSWETGDIIETYRMITKRRTLTK
jgi:translation initiation factor IF-2